MKSKLIAIPYTLGIIKPHILAKEDKVTRIMINFLVIRSNGYPRGESLRNISFKEENIDKGRSPKFVLYL